MKTKTRLLSFMVLIGFLTGCKLFRSPSYSTDQKNYSNVEESIVTFPFEYVNKLIKVNASVNSNSREYSFILDSGAPTVINDSVVFNNQLKYINSQSAIDANGNEQSFDIYKMKHLSLNGYPIKNLKALSNKHVNQIPAVNGRVNGGLLGANVLDNAVWMIDYKNQQITMSKHPDSLPIPSNAIITKMYRNTQGNPMIEVVFSDNKKVDLMVDLGYNGSVLLPQSYFSKPIFNDSLTSKEKQTVSTGFETGVKEMDYHYLKAFKTGMLLAYNVKSSTTGKNDQALLGNAFLEKYTIVMDFIRNRLIFIPEEPICANTVC